MFKEWYRSGDGLLHEIAESHPGKNELYIWNLGQCGFVFKKDVVVYIDPVLNDMTDAAGKSRRFFAPPFAPELARADYVLCTHAHADHMALPGLLGIHKANPGAIFIVPAACIGPMTEYGISRDCILEARAGRTLVLPSKEESCQEPLLTIHPVSAAHPTHQTTPDGGDVALSYALTFKDDICVLHLGDTYLTDRLFTDLKALPAPDLFFPPVNGGDYFRTARNCIGNLSAVEAARLACELNADLTIPTHHDMIFGNVVDPLDFVRELRKLDTARKWTIPNLGERIIYKK